MPSLSKTKSMSLKATSTSRLSVVLFALSAFLVQPMHAQNARTDSSQTVGQVSTPRPPAVASSYLPYDADIYSLIDQAIILLGPRKPPGFGAYKPYLRADLAQLADSLATEPSLSQSMQGILKFLRLESVEMLDDAQLAAAGLATKRKYFYANQADLFSVRTKDFDLHANFAFNGEFGKEVDAAGRRYINTRGIELRGTIDKKLSFYTYFADNQALLPGYVADYNFNTYSVFPRFAEESFVKLIDDKPNLTRQQQGYDFITARGHFAFNATRHIQLSAGQDRLYNGYGMRSLILGDQSPAFPFMRIDAKVWRIHYSSTFSQMKAGGRKPNDTYIPTKWVSMHNLEVQVLRNLKISLFESVVAAPADTAKRGFYDLSYLNPIIFYRAVEQFNGSSDNSLIGTSLAWDFLRHFQLYGQLVLDEFKLDNIVKQNGWWANKYAMQAGIKAVEPFGLRGLMLQGEYNYVRPFTYTHKDKFLSYSNYGLPIAHPIGANFTELLGRLEYAITPTVRLHGQGMWLQYGADTPAENYGQDIMRSYNSRAREFGNETKQGTATDVKLLQGRVSWMVMHRLYLEAGVLYRRYTSATPQASYNTTYLTLSTRWNIHKRNFLF